MLLWLVFLALFLVCAGMSAVFMVYVCIVWLTLLGQAPSPKPTASKGLSPSELERLPGVEDGGRVKGMECAVCLDDIEEGQPSRVLPECRHAFHRPCADAWLSSNAVCPVCRAVLLPPTPLSPEAHSQVGAV